VAVTTLSAVQRYLGIGSTDAALLSALIPIATKTAARWCGVDSFEAASYTEYHNGECADKVVLKNIPVNSVTSVAVVDGTASAAVGSTTYTTDTLAGILGFRGPSGPLAWDLSLPMGQGGRFPDGFRNVKVVYSGGYSTVPADLNHAMVELVSQMYRARGVNQSLQSETIGQYSYTRAADTGATSINDFLESRFGAWKRPGV
jgi:hypothetical protein